MLLERMEAFLVNHNMGKLNLESLGKFETNLLEISQKKVCWSLFRYVSTDFMAFLFLLDCNS